jgi:hypothetical protein
MLGERTLYNTLGRLRNKTRNNPDFFVLTWGQAACKISKLLQLPLREG